MPLCYKVVLGVVVSESLYDYDYEYMCTLSGQYPMLVFVHPYYVCMHNAYVKYLPNLYLFCDTVL